jgi:hypothetical protein
VTTTVSAKLAERIIQQVNSDEEIQELISLANEELSVFGNVSPITHKKIQERLDLITYEMRFGELEH